MSMYNLHNKNVQIQYKSRILSRAMLFNFVMWFIVISFPFIIAYRSRGFWLKDVIFYEQPDMKFKYQYLFIAETNDLERTISCGYLPNFTHMIQNNEDCLLFQAQENDLNHDGRVDEFHFNVIVNVPEGLHIVYTSLYLIFDFQLNTVCPLQMESLTYIEKSFCHPASELTIYADSMFYQSESLYCLRNYKDIQYNKSVTDVPANTNQIKEVIESYYHRKVSTRLGNKMVRVKNGDAETMAVSVKMRVSDQAIRYKPHFWQILKWAWLQYLSLLLILYWIVTKIKSYVFYYRLLPAWEVIPWKQCRY